MALLNNKVVVVTGGGKGLGRAIAMALAREGADVAITGRDQAALSETADRIRSGTGREVVAYATDISHSENVTAFANEVKQHFDYVHILVNNAAGWLTAGLLEATEEEIDAVIDTTIKAPIWLCQQFWEQLKNANPGHIISITTTGARPKKSSVSPIYIAAKFGLWGFTDALRRAAIKDGIRVTEILPGSAASDFDLADSDREITGKYGHERIPPRDVAEAVIFALSRSSAAIVEEIRIPSVGDVWSQQKE